MNLTAFVCKYEGCNLIYENPVTLPCGNSLCQQHLDKFEEKFMCHFCSKKHLIPEDGFSVSKTIIEMIECHLKLDPLRKKVKESFENLEKSINQYEDIQSDVYIDSYFYEIRNKVDLHREELKKEIDDRSDEIIQQLKVKEEKCKLNAHKHQKMNLDELKNTNLPALKQKFRIPSINENELKDLSSVLDDNVKIVRNNKRKYENDLLDNQSIKFEKYEKSSLFGKLIVQSIDLVLSPKCGELIREYKQHFKLIRSIEVDEKSNKIISASNDETIKIWDLETGECLNTLFDHIDWVTGILILSRDNKFVSGSRDKTIKIWDLNSYECLNTFTNESSVYSLCLLPNNQIACACYDGFIIIWNLYNSAKVKTFKAHDDWIAHLLLVDETKLISCAGDKKIKIWNLATFDCIKQLNSHSSYIFSLEITDKFFSCSHGKTVKFWHIESGEMLKSINFEHPVYCVKTLNADLIAIGLYNGEIKIYDLKLGETVKTISSNSSLIFKLNYLSNGNLLSGSANGEIKLWKIFE